MSEKKLESIHQQFVVQQLAMFSRAVDVQKALKQDFEIEISLPGICYYDISNPALPKKLKTLFNSTRRNFLKNSDKIPIAQKSFRLMKLQKMFETEENETPRMQNKKAMRELLEQAAKESGDAFTNKQKHEVTGKDGSALVPRKITVNVVRSASILENE